MFTYVIEVKSNDSLRWQAFRSYLALTGATRSLRKLKAAHPAAKFRLRRYVPEE